MLREMDPFKVIRKMINNGPFVTSESEEQEAVEKAFEDNKDTVIKVYLQKQKEI